jgi:hypothetical protein
MADETLTVTPEHQALATIDAILRRDELYEDVGLSLFLIMEALRGTGYPPYPGYK